MKTKLMLFAALLAGASNIYGSKLQEGYIAQYRDIAIREMKQYGIPASITLAQGLLESASGTSYLAVKANNHFGIKCHLDWQGKKVYRDDDSRNECFRAYRHAEESFRDHSLFLRNRSRYASLFEEDPTDYKAWAKGLKKAGYATNRKYADLLIELVERYQLHQYDDPSFKPVKKQSKALAEEPADINVEKLQVYLSPNRVKFVVAGEGEDIYDIAIKTQRWPGELQRYNELEERDRIKAGQRVYLQPKRKKASKDNKFYTVKQGETIYSISQKFAIRSEHLRRKNHLKEGEELKAGDKLRLR